MHLTNVVFSGTKEWDADSVRRITGITPAEDGESSYITVDNAITRSLPTTQGPEPEYMP